MSSFQSTIDQLNNEQAKTILNDILDQLCTDETQDYFDHVRDMAAGDEVKFTTQGMLKLLEIYAVVYAIHGLKITALDDTDLIRAKFESLEASDPEMKEYCDELKATTKHLMTFNADAEVSEEEEDQSESDESLWDFNND